MKKARITFVVICLAICLLLISNASAATFNAASCSQADVQAQVNAAKNGDTVIIPAGSCTWRSTVSLTKGITLQGTGENSTIINSNGQALISISASRGIGDYRITQFGFTRNGSGSQLLQFFGEWNTLRLDHCTFNMVSSASGSLVLIGNTQNWNTATNSPKALFDHITMNSPTVNNQFMKIWGANNSWTQPDNYGSDYAVYVEDSVFNCAAGISGSLSDTEGGARMVIRHNSITNCGIYMHDTGSTQGCRGNRLVEIYDNNFSGCAGGGNCPSSVGIAMRGGTGVIYNNKIGPGFWLRMRQQTFGPQAVRWVRDPCGDMGKCDNIPETICSTFTGHCLSSGLPCTGSWDCNDCRWHCTTNAECNPRGSGTVVCLSQFDGQLHDSSYPDPGWPCRDQNGRGKDDPVTHMNTSSPFYVWNNKDENGNSITMPPDPNFSKYTQEGRDYCNHSPVTSPNPQHPGKCNGIALNYTPYTYPHPLQAGR
jgi:hypothetical protein